MKDDIDRLRDLSAKLGNDQMLVQAGGCNTSVKTEEGLWIKASGARLTDAYDLNTFLLCDWSQISGWRKGSIEVLEVDSPGGERSRASVETAMHLALPHRFVAHLHSVRALSWLVQVHGMDEVGLRLAGLNWHRMPYVHPGLTLANHIKQSLKGQYVDILLLDNHGVVIGAETSESLWRLIEEVEIRLDAGTRWSTEVGQTRANNPIDGWIQAHGLPTRMAFDADAIRIASGGTLYPDHCVYLGPSIARAPNRSAIPKTLESYKNLYRSDAKSLLIDNEGTYLSSTAKPASTELLLCLANVINRIPKYSVVQYLPDSAVRALIGWDAEAYRLSVEARSVSRREKVI